MPLPLPGQKAFDDIKVSLEKVLAVVQPSAKVVFLSSPPLVDGDAESNTADSPQVKKSVINTMKAVYAARNGYLVETVGGNTSLFWIDQNSRKTAIDPKDTDTEFLNELVELAKHELDAHVDLDLDAHVDLDVDPVTPPAHTTMTLSETDIQKLIGTHYIEKQYLTIKNYQIDKKNNKHKVPEPFKAARDKLVSEIDAIILERAEKLFEKIKNKIKTHLTKSYEDLEQPMPEVLYSKINALLETIDTLYRGEDFANQIVELTTVLEATDRLLMNPNQTEIQIYQNLSKTVQGSANEEMQNVGASMLSIGMFMVLYGALLILLALTPPPVLIGLLFAGVVVAGVGATITPIGIGFFAGSQPKGIARNMDDVGEECTKLAACTH